CSCCPSLRRRKRAKRSISPETSCCGRCQFSLLKANRVRQGMPRVAQRRIMRRAASAPALCPSRPLPPCCFSQRVLPSMMPHTCRGISAPPGSADAALCCVGAAGWLSGDCTWESGGLSDGQQVRLLFTKFLLDLGNVVVGHLLDVLLCAALFVLADRLFLEQVLDVGVGIA